MRGDNNCCCYNHHTAATLRVRVDRHRAASGAHSGERHYRRSYRVHFNILAILHAQICSTGEISITFDSLTAFSAIDIQTLTNVAVNVLLRAHGETVDVLNAPTGQLTYNDEAVVVDEVIVKPQGLPLNPFEVLSLTLHVCQYVPTGSFLKCFIVKMSDILACNTAQWSEWSDCTQTCGMGSRSRTRTIIGDASSCAGGWLFLRLLQKCSLQLL